MADEAHNSHQPEGSNPQPQRTPAEPSQWLSNISQWFFRTFAPCLRAAWLQPLVPTLVVQPTLRTTVTFNYLPPNVTVLQPTSLRREDPPPIPQSVALHPSAHGWGMTGSFPGSFTGPMSSSYRPAEQWPANLQPTDSHQRTKVAYGPPDTQEARGTAFVETGGRQRQDINMPPLEIPSRTNTASSSVAPIPTPSEGPMGILNLHASEDEGSGTLAAKKTNSRGPVQSGQLMETKILPVARGETTEESKEGILNTAVTLKRHLQMEKLPPKKRKMDDPTSPAQPKIKIHLPDPQMLRTKEKTLDIKESGSKSKDLPTDKKNTQLKKAQAPIRPTARNKMQAKQSTEPLQPVPKSNLAWRMMESVKVFHPLGKNSISTMAAPKAPSGTSSSIPMKPASTCARPDSKALAKPVLKPLQNPSATTVSKAQPPVPKPLPKPPPSSLAKPSDIPVLVPQPVPRVKPQLTSLKRSHPSSVAMRPPTLHSGQGISRPPNQRPIHSQPRGPMGTIPRFCPRTLPRDHGLGLRCYPCPPVLPFQVAFRNWRPPPRDLEFSTPITEEQRPGREMMKRLAQKQREEAAKWTSLGRVHYFEQRQKEMEISVKFGYL